MKKILLTGSSSYLGTKFVDLYGSDYKIVEISRDNALKPIDLNDHLSVRGLFEQECPDIIVHLAADLGRDAAKNDSIKVTNPAITKLLIDLAKQRTTPIIFTSSEAVYGGKINGMYTEKEVYKPRSAYGEAKVLSEELIIASGLPYLITRGHRYVGVSKRCRKSKQFVDAYQSLIDGKQIHVDAKKLFSPVLIDDICDVINHYIQVEPSAKRILNVGIGKPITYYDFLVDVAKATELDASMILPDGDESGWHNNNSLSTETLRSLGYPHRDYQEVLATIAKGLHEVI